MSLPEPRPTPKDTEDPGYGPTPRRIAAEAEADRIEQRLTSLVLGALREQAERMTSKPDAGQDLVVEDAGLPAVGGANGLVEPAVSQPRQVGRAL